MLFLYLHKVAADERFTNVDVIVFGGKLSRRPFQIESIHDAGELLTNVIGRLERTEIDKILVTPLEGKNSS